MGRAPLLLLFPFFLLLLALPSTALWRGDVAPFCQVPSAQSLLYGVSWEDAQSVCCANHHYAERSGHFEDLAFFRALRASPPPPSSSSGSDPGPWTFYDVACGLPIFRAPIGRSLEVWEAESVAHGWPSFRQAEIIAENTVERPNGEVLTKCPGGKETHLGHNIPDGKGSRFCITLVCMAAAEPAAVMAATATNATAATATATTTTT